MNASSRSVSPSRFRSALGAHNTMSFRGGATTAILTQSSVAAESAFRALVPCAEVAFGYAAMRRAVGRPLAEADEEVRDGDPGVSDSRLADRLQDRQSLETDDDHHDYRL